MNKTVLAGIVAGILVLGLILAPLSIDQFAEGKHFKRIIQTETLKSGPHRATGHESHQAIEVLPPMKDVIYKGTLSYTASKSVDVLVYHKLSGEEMGQKIHEMDGVKYTIEKVVNGTQGNARFVGDAVLFHSAESEPYTVTVSIAAQARAMMGELPSKMPKMEEKPGAMMPSAVRTITVSEWQPWFQPTALQVDPGTPIVWEASETTTIHTITFVTRVTDLKLNMDPEFTAKTFTLISPGDKSPPWTPKAGVYVYICAIHPYMTGVISAGVPYNAVTGAIGTSKDDPTVLKWAPWYPSVAPWQDFRPYRAPPATSGIGEIWVDTQFEVQTDPSSPTGKFGSPWPGTITIVDASTWKVSGKIGKVFNGPHNLRESQDEKYVLQGNWHDDYLTLIDKQSRQVVKNYIQTGPSPTHIFWYGNDKYAITAINAGSELQIFDGAQLKDPNVPASAIKPIATIKASVPLAGPHGFWLTPDGLLAIPYHLANYAVVASIEEKKELHKPINLGELPDDITADPNDKIGPGITFASYIGPEINKHRFWVTTEVLLSHEKLLQGRLIMYDIGSAVGGPTNPTFVKMLEMGSTPIQSPVSSDGEYVVTGNAGGIGVPGMIKVTQLDYNNPVNSKVVATLPAYPGNHGVEYGYKKDGGLYAYVTNKFAPVLQVVDLTTSPPSLAGEVDLGNGWGGMGVDPIPNAGWYPTLESHPHGKLYK